MKKLLLLTLLMTGCNKEVIRLKDHDGRITDLESRMLLVEQTNVLQDQLIQMNHTQVMTEIELLKETDETLLSLIEQEEQARIAGDQDNAQALQQAIMTQSVVNAIVQGQLLLINLRFPLINSRLSSLQSQLNNTNARIDDLDTEVNTLQTLVSTLSSNQDALSQDLSELSDEVDELKAKTVEVLKCNSSSSTERILKINGKFYAVMNRVTTEQVQVISGSSSTSFTNPQLCIKDNKAKLPNGNGQCPSSWTSVGGNTVNVPSYSTSTKTVVTSVKMTLELLTNGSYQTTDGGPACTFSVSGSTSTNLVAAQ